MRLDPGIRGLFGKLIKKGLMVTRVAELFDTTRQTMHRWLKRAKYVCKEYFKDRPRAPRAGKVTDEVEISILTLRNTISWGNRTHTIGPPQAAKLHPGGGVLRAERSAVQGIHKQHSREA